jgi:hypothetical protein
MPTKKSERRAVWVSVIDELYVGKLALHADGALEMIHKASTKPDALASGS